MWSPSGGRCTGWTATPRSRCSSGSSRPKASSSYAPPTPSATAATRGSTNTTRPGAPGRGTICGPTQAGRRGPIGTLRPSFAARGSISPIRSTSMTSQEVSVSDLARRVLTFSPSSPEVLGDRIPSDAERCRAASASLQPQRRRHGGIRLSGAGGEAIKRRSALIPQGWAKAHCAVPTSCHATGHRGHACALPTLQIVPRLKPARAKSARPASAGSRYRPSARKN